jgi:hypothetical protein
MPELRGEHADSLVLCLSSVSEPQWVHNACNLQGTPEKDNLSEGIFHYTMKIYFSISFDIELDTMGCSTISVHASDLSKC